MRLSLRGVPATNQSILLSLRGMAEAIQYLGFFGHTSQTML